MCASNASERPSDVLPIEKRAGIVLKSITVGRWYFLQWHVNEPPFDNPKLRQAFAHAIDRARLNEITMRGQGIVSNGPTPEGTVVRDAPRMSLTPTTWQRPSVPLGTHASVWSS